MDDMAYMFDAGDGLPSLPFGIPKDPPVALDDPSPVALDDPSPLAECPPPRDAETSKQRHWRKYGQKALKQEGDGDPRRIRCYYRCNSENCPVRVRVTYTEGYGSETKQKGSHISSQCVGDFYPSGNVNYHNQKTSHKRPRLPSESAPLLPTPVHSVQSFNPVAIVRCARATRNAQQRIDHPCLDATTTFWNLTGYEPSDCIGRDMRMLQGPGTDKTTIREISDALKRGDSITRTLVNYRKDGSAYMCSLVIFPTPNEFLALIQQ